MNEEYYLKPKRKSSGLGIVFVGIVLGVAIWFWLNSETLTKPHTTIKANPAATVEVAPVVPPANTNPTVVVVNPVVPPAATVEGYTPAAGVGAAIGAKLGDLAKYAPTVTPAK